MSAGPDRSAPRRAGRIVGLFALVLWLTWTLAGPAEASEPAGGGPSMAEILLAQADGDSTVVVPGPARTRVALPDTVAPGPARQREAALDGLRRAQRSARTAVLMSAVVPGWGQFYADSPFWGIVAFSVQMYYIGNIVMEGRRAERQSVRRDLEAPDSQANLDRGLLVTEHRERVRDYVWWSAGGLLVIGLDAYVSVALADFDDPYPPTPDLDRDWDLDPEPGGDAGAGVKLSLDFDF